MTQKLALLAALICATTTAAAPAQTPAKAAAPGTVLVEPLRTFDAAGTRSRSAVLSIDTTFLYTGDEDGTIKKLRTDTGEAVTTMRITNARVNAMRLSNDGRRLIVGSSDGIAHVFDTARGTEISKRKMPGDVLSVWINNDGTRVLSGGGTTVCYWVPDDTTDAVLTTFKGHTGNVKALDATPDGRFAVSGGSDKTVCLWEPATGRELTKFTAHTADVTGVAIDGLGTHIVSGDAGMTVCTWTPADPTSVKRFEDLREPVVDLDLSDDGTKAVVAGTFRVLVFDPALAKTLNELTPTRFRNYSVRLQPDRRRIVVGRDADTDSPPDRRGTVKIFEVQ